MRTVEGAAAAAGRTPAASSRIVKAPRIRAAGLPVELDRQHVGARRTDREEADAAVEVVAGRIHAVHDGGRALADAGQRRGASPADAGADRAVVLLVEHVGHVELELQLL